jgi:hypothetical protein
VTERLQEVFAKPSEQAKDEIAAAQKERELHALICSASCSICAFDPLSPAGAGIGLIEGGAEASDLSVSAAGAGGKAVQPSLWTDIT